MDKTPQKILEHRGEAEVPPLPHHPGTTKANTGWCRTTQFSHEPMFLEWEKGPVWTSSFLSIVSHLLGAPNLVLSDRACGGICRAWPLGILLSWRWGEEFAITNIQIMADGIPTCSVQVVVPISSFVHLQRQDGGTV